MVPGLKWTRSFRLIRTHPEGRLCGVRLGRWHIYVLDEAVHHLDELVASHLDAAQGARMKR
jgi:hypothetical protein